MKEEKRETISVQSVVSCAGPAPVSFLRVYGLPLKSMEDFDF